MTTHGTLQLQTVEGTGLRFEARFSNSTILFDSGPEAAAANPMLNLLGALAACEAMDVISILRKKRLEVTGYEVAMTAERAEAHPKRYTSVQLVHRVSGRGVPREALEEAVRLSEEKYCSVRATLDPAMPVTSRCEVAEG
jgi:putative redox protein